MATMSPKIYIVAAGGGREAPPHKPALNLGPQDRGGIWRERAYATCCAGSAKMDEGGFSISAKSLYSQLGVETAPVVVDVRRSGLGSDDRMIVGAIRRNPDEIQSWREAVADGREVVVYCADGDELSKEVALAVRRAGVDAYYLEHGIARWAELQLPMRRTRVYADDYAMLERGMIVYDALYAWSRDCRDQGHDWNPAAMARA
jgi:rhodanese-related sulfurtransferase